MISFWSDIQATAKVHDLDPILVAALVQVESGGNPWAWNPEPRYAYFWDVKRNAPFRAVSREESAAEKPPADFPTISGDPDNEWWAQQASWGLMQVMGAVARERGFSAEYLTALCDPVPNLVVGCKVLQSLMRWADRNNIQALAAYNGGRGGNARPPYRNVLYAQKVLSAMPLVKGQL